MPPSFPATPRRGRAATIARVFGYLVVALVLATGAAVVAMLMLTDAGDPEPEVADRALPAAPTEGQRTLLLVRHDGDGRPASGLTLLAAGPGDAPATILFLPAGTLVDIPGVGLDRLGLAQQYGEGVLTHAAVENLLGIQIDYVATISDAGLGAFLGGAGGLTVDVPSRLVERGEDGAAHVRFEPGEQFLDGPRLAEYWGFVERGEDELASFPRQQQVLGQLLDVAADPDQRRALVGDGAPRLDTTASSEWLDDWLAALADARAEGRLRFVLMPVDPFGGGGPDGTQTFRVQEEAVVDIVETHLAASLPAEGDARAVRVQVLNGVGVPGVGQEVDHRLRDGRFRIVLTDNARSFDFTDTRILVYDESPESLEAAQRVRELLGVGTIQVNRQPQSVVDLTIVVGADFLEDGHPGGDGEADEQDEQGAES